ncbi:Jnm1p [Saccharomyces eubayanus]|uniref:Jnm1p n=1 Tax=Saccharomyces eubayanus TaxID=1080349 RepID=UPI0006C5FF8E|nr:JNM1-like protein [Saccharomyces eubayanus]KOG97623.1 JNM1-like protein [Saccharomyces eubayanus]
MNVIDLSDPAISVDYDSLIGIDDEESQEVFENEVKEDAQQEQQEGTVLTNDKIIVEPKRDIESLRKVIREQLLFDVLRNRQSDHNDERKVISNKDAESRQGKLDRIRKELKELETEDPSLERRNEIRELCKLQSKLAIQSSSRFANLEKELIGDSESQPITMLPDISLDMTSIKRLQKLDQRISGMERYVGVPGILEGQEDGKSVYNRVNELYRTIQLLQDDDKEGEKLRKFQDRLMELNEQFENSLLGKKMQRDQKLGDETVNKIITPESKIKEINDMYAMFKQYRDSLPQLTERMKALNKMNNKVVDVYETTRRLDSQITSVREQEQVWLKTLEQLDVKFNEQETKIRQNMDQITRKIDSLEDRVSHSKTEHKIDE